MTKFISLLVIVVNIICGIVSVPGGSSFGGVFKMILAPGNSPYAFSVEQANPAEKAGDFIKWYNFLRRADRGQNGPQKKISLSQSNENETEVYEKITH